MGRWPPVADPLLVLSVATVGIPPPETKLYVHLLKARPSAVDGFRPLAGVVLTIGPELLPAAATQFGFPLASDGTKQLPALGSSPFGQVAETLASLPDELYAGTVGAATRT